MMATVRQPVVRPQWEVLVAYSGVDAARPWVDEVDRLVAPWQISLSRAADDRQAFARIEAGGVDLAIVGDDTPGTGGLRTLEEFRHRFRELPCVLVTAVTSAMVLHRALELRAESVVPQPVDSPLLADLMVRILRRRFAL